MMKVSLLLLMMMIVNTLYAKNVLIILGDDVGFESGVYGNRVCRTPNIDSLARRSLVFDNAFTSVSSCSPSRSALLTGLPQHQNGMYGLENGYHHFQSFPTVKSISSILIDNNIYTGIIGKKHVSPLPVYPFNFSRTEQDHYSTNQVGRNITLIKLLVREFLSTANNKDFLLYVAFHDAHRCGHTNPKLGAFCEKFGDSSIPGMGDIHDWKPAYYQPSQVEVPYFVPDTPTARRDIAAQYKTISRLDQGVGLIIKELKDSGVLDDTLILYTSDNGIPFPSGRTNLYEPGIREPFLISHPTDKSSWGKRTDSLVSLLDVMPTVLDWFEIALPHYSIFKHSKKVQLTGQSLLGLVRSSPKELRSEGKAVYASHSLHEITMYYPMRSIRTSTYKLIHNINYLMPFSIDQDFYISPTFQDMLNRVKKGLPLPWYKSLSSYYYRPQWELYDLSTDPQELLNLHHHPGYANISYYLMKQLNAWQNITSDPWICSPNGVLQDSGASASKPACLPLYNNL